MLIAAIIIIAVLGIAILLMVGVIYPDNVAETALDGGKKNLKTRIYKTDLETAEKTVKEIIPTLSTYGNNWRLVGETGEAEKGKVIKSEVPVVVFTDDFDVYLKQNGNEISIDAKSKSRIGKSDFGENARHINQLLNTLDEKFKE